MTLAQQTFDAVWAPCENGQHGGDIVEWVKCDCRKALRTFTAWLESVEVRDLTRDAVVLPEGVCRCEFGEATCEPCAHAAGSVRLLLARLVRQAAERAVDDGLDPAKSEAPAVQGEGSDQQTTDSEGA